MSKQEARNTAAGMVRDALEQLTKWERVQDLRRFDNTKEEAARLLDMAEAALSYFEHHYDFPQGETRREVWAVVTADPRSDDPGYKAYASIFANRSDALKCLKNTAAEDAEQFGGVVRWHDDDTDEPWCEVVCDGEARWVHTLDRKEVTA